MNLSSIFRPYILAFFIIAILGISCKKFVAIDPPVTGLIGNVVYSKDATAAAAVNSIFYNTAASFSLLTGANGLTTLTGLAADELTTDANSSLTLQQYYKNALLPSSQSFWPSLYSRIYQCNEVVEGINNSNKLSPNLKSQFLGEAKFIRAFLYFYAVNLYGDVPLALTTDYKINSTISRTSESKVWDQIIKDLEEAKAVLPVNYYTPQGGASSERVLPVKAAATALLARVYLYREEWANAVEEATITINDSQYSLNTDLSLVFQKNSSDAIWQLGAIDVAASFPSIFSDGGFFVILNTPTAYSYPVSLSKSTFDMFSNNDKRKTEWINSFTDASGTFNYAYKYRTSNASQTYNEYIMALRISEQYLIRAEANAQLSKFIEAADDINKIRVRSGLDEIAITDRDSALSAIAIENRKEFFCELGHRWLSLKRTKTIDQVMSATAELKGSVWKSEYQNFPIPESEITLNPNMVQNKGY
jgi:starch-binding outer membrane protein, SusD/RagB family